jgi:ATP-dependent Zn protease
MEKTLGPNVSWRPCEADVVEKIAGVLKADAPDRLADATVAEARSARLPFYERHELIELRLAGVPGLERAFLLFGGDQVLWLDGSSGAIHDANETEALALTDATVLDYVRFFLLFVRGDSGSFTLIESAEELAPKTVSVETLTTRRTQVAAFGRRERAGEGPFTVDATVAYGGSLFAAVFTVEPGGNIEMAEDTPLATLDGVAVPSSPDLAARPVDPPAKRKRPKATRAEIAAGLERLLATAATKTGESRPDDRQVTEAVVSVLLAEAVRASLGHRLLQRFNSLAQASGSIGQLTQFVRDFAPIVIIESEIPFVEDIVWGLLDPGRTVFPEQVVARASAVSGDDSRCAVDARSAQANLLLLSFHAYRTLWDAEWTSHQLAIGTSTVLIGCDRRADVPEPLRRVADLVLTLPRIDARLFVDVFRQVLGVPPPAGWDAGGSDWTRYLLHTDFHAPLRLKLAPGEAIDYLRERCAARLAQVSADTSPRLEDLHGLGEARQVAEDLIADIAAARAGKIAWSAVDRGLLLVGPPGTGKTTLARAIARACGVKFIQASAAQWQSTGALDVHLRAIRDSFAEARRYAPAILFLDEIDSIGSREQLSGSNAIYQTEVINAVLEQLQGIDPEEPVMVIGATNHVEKVDPALRRAGRLDQVVTIPLPNVAGLEQIFAFHLKPYRAAKQVGRDVDDRLLAQLAFGLTGADVEFFVRGAARRARKAGRGLSQADLVAEITRRPRRPDSVIRLTPEEMRRVAAHEAGHALIGLLNAKAAPEITFVSIVPRTNGSLGFTATAPPEGAVMTRREVLERLQMVLAGRAAEELVYGKEDVGLGAGGGVRSDLAVATHIATRLVCTSGLGADGSLHWTEAPTPAQQKQIDALLRESYRETLARLRRHRRLLDLIVTPLVERQELSGAELRALIAGGARAPAANGRRRARNPGRG